MEKGPDNFQHYLDNDGEYNIKAVQDSLSTSKSDSLSVDYSIIGKRMNPKAGD